MQPQRLRVLEQGVIYRLGDNAPRKVDFRLVAVTGLRIPPMRERPADIALLARLAAYPWPGNVRELRNVIEAAVLTSPDRPLQVQQLQLDPSIFSGLAWATERVQEIPSMAESEEQLIVRAIAACDGNLTRSAKHLNIAKSTLYAKMQRYGLRG